MSRIFRLLVADGDRFSRMRVVRAAGGLDHCEIVNAVSGLEALRWLEANPFMADCVISGLEMPEMDGLRLLREIRAGRGAVNRGLPFLLLTRHGDKGLVGLALALDADGYLLKPADPEVIQWHVRRVLFRPASARPVLRSPDYYRHVDAGRRVAKVLNLPAEPPAEVSAPDGVNRSPGSEYCYRLDDIPEHSVLARDIRDRDGTAVFMRGIGLSGGCIEKLRGLARLGCIEDMAWVYPAAGMKPGALTA